MVQSGLIKQHQNGTVWIDKTTPNSNIESHCG